jgi:hypothetical protein
LKLQKIKLNDFVKIVNIYNDVINNMIINNIFQWDEIYPNEIILREDIVKKQIYAGILNKEIVSVFVLNKDFDEEYLNAKWQYKDNDFIVFT